MPPNKPLTFSRFETDDEILKRIEKENVERLANKLTPRPVRNQRESVQDYLDRVAVQRQIVWDDRS